MSVFPDTTTTATEPTEETGGAHDVFVARQPIFDDRKRLFAYELLFRGGLENFCPAGDPDRAAGQVLQAAWLTFGLQTLIGGNKAFVNFTRDLLIKGYGETLPVESTVIELLETIDGDPEVVLSCKRLKDRGYLLALDDFVYRPSLEPLLEFADLIKIDFQESDAAEQVEHVRRTAKHGPKLLAEKVETEEEYLQAKEIGFNYFQGYFFCRPQIIKGRTLEGSRLTYLRLLQAVTAPGLDIAELDQIIRTDVSITHRFMKYLGSASFGFRRTVSNVRQGLVLLGKEQTRRWVSLMALGEIGRNKPQEILVSAAVRAKLCEVMGEEAGMTDRTADLFLLGALSLVDAMLDQPMTVVLDELPLAADLKLALLGESSELRPILEFVKRYERGDWATCEELGKQLGIPQANVLTRYRDAVLWATHALTG